MKSPGGKFPDGSALLVRDLDMKFGNTKVLHDLNFVISIGSLCGLVGPNGAGKTTTMRILVSDLEPTEGRVEVFGWKLPDESRRARSRIGYMPDQAGLYEELTLFEYLGFFAAFHGLGREERRVAAETAMALTGMEPFARRRLKGLSKGEKQRVLLARALVHDPDLLILDEPADGLDPRGRVELKELLLLLHERGKTIVISSHILADLQEICTDFVFVDGGRILFQGTRERLLADGLRHATVRIEVLNGQGNLMSHLAGVVRLDAVERPDGTVELRLPADPAFACNLLRGLVAAGIPVVSFVRTTESLEAVYLRLTAHDGQE